MKTSGSAGRGIASTQETQAIGYDVPPVAQPFTIEDFNTFRQTRPLIRFPGHVRGTLRGARCCVHRIWRDVLADLVRFACDPGSACLPALSFCTDRDHEIVCGRAADVLQAVHLLGRGIGDPSGPKIVRVAIRRKLDTTLPNQHELGMEMLVCRMRHLAR